MSSLPSPSHQNHTIIDISDCPSCHRHQLGLPYQRLADEAFVQGIQNELETLSPKSQELITSTWASFLNFPDKERRILIDGILARCCSSQLSYISTSIKALTRIDFFAVLPTELSYRILQYLDATTLCRLAQVSHLWRKLADDDVIWHRMCEQHINTKCSKCGWSLPLLQRQGRLVQSQNPDLGKSSLESWNSIRKVDDLEMKADIPPSRSSSTSRPPAKRQRGLHHEAVKLDPPCHPRQTRPWKEVYRERLMVGLNWKHGRYRTTVLEGHSDSVMCLQIHGNYLATGSYDATVKLWSLDPGELLRTFEGHTAGIRALQFDGHKIISGSLDRTIKIWNWQTGECVLTFSGHDDGIIGLDVAGNILASSSMDETIKAWNFENKEAFTLRGHSDAVNSVKFDMASRTLISASDDFTLRLWDLDTRQCIRTFEGHCGQIQQVAFLSPQIEHSLELGLAGSTLATTYDKAVEGIQVSYGSGFLTHPERPLPPLYVLSASLDDTLRLWNTTSGACVRANLGHTQGIWALAVDGLRAVSGAGDSITKVWDVVTGNCVRTLTGHTAPVTCIALTDSVIATGSDDCRVIVSNFKP
ncbi:ubiquitin-binding SDF ubiquitin ligase complex subunit met30 [Microsporum canis]|uniref:Probable E3 ubiquitin ligase complex SCF subunit sconB n=1 Tax=Arthroderma otae (strain ATCC MYA-4605 / CBS 113480) TaxID=554155 RepID=C5FK76_ARTOC|nr:sulfur metabolite repression control protein [Microsporum canis CBS 113480]EEQ30098.1 sulfur metabolite repression control protein [Microsporum canis CBS 113480]